MKGPHRNGGVSEMCRQAHSRGGYRLQQGERLLSDLGLSARETTVLQIARCFFQSFAQPASQGWLTAHRVAAAEIPADHAPATLCATLEMVQGLRVSRRSIFRFSNPYCAACGNILTAHERLLMASLAEFVSGRPEEAQRHATLLCEGNCMDEFLSGCEALARCIEKSTVKV